MCFREFQTTDILLSEQRELIENVIQHQRQPPSIPLSEQHGLIENVIQHQRDVKTFHHIEIHDMNKDANQCVFVHVASWYIEFRTKVDNWDIELTVCVFDENAVIIKMYESG